MHIGIAGAESRTRCGIEETKYFKMKTPGEEEDDPGANGKDVFSGHWGNIYLGKRDRLALGLGLGQFIDDGEDSIFQIPPDGNYSGNNEKNQQPFLNVKVEWEGKYIKPDVFVKNGVCAAKRLLVYIEQDHIPSVGAICCNEKTGNKKKTDNEGIR